MKALSLAGLLIFLALPTYGCSVGHDWRAPTPEEAFASAQVVVHARVLSQSGLNSGNVVADIAVIRTLKGSLSGHTVRTASGSLCGVTNFNVGEEYVFFLPSSDFPFVSSTAQSAGIATEQVLKALARVSR
jgi:hypothetical protein